MLDPSPKCSTQRIFQRFSKVSPRFSKMLDLEDILQNARPRGYIFQSGRALFLYMAAATGRRCCRQQARLYSYSLPIFAQSCLAETPYFPYSIPVSFSWLRRPLSCYRRDSLRVSVSRVACAFKTSTLCAVMRRVRGAAALAAFCRFSWRRV